MSQNPVVSRAAVAPSPSLLEQALDTLVAAPQGLLAQRALLQRSDTKFVVPRALLPTLVVELAPHYALLPSAAGAGAPYRTLYLDTAERTCFHDHRRGRRVRHKVRIRHYDDRRVSFLEVKSRRSSRLTDKHRVEVPYDGERLRVAEGAFVERCTGLCALALRPQAWVDYRRVTLLGLHRDERCTIDLDLSVSTPDRHRHSAMLQQWALLEVKQPPGDDGSPLVAALRAARLRPVSLSKYTVAVTALFPHERANRLLPDLRCVRGGAR
jgi:VTC domain